MIRWVGAVIDRAVDANGQALSLNLNFASI